MKLSKNLKYILREGDKDLMSTDQNMPSSENNKSEEEKEAK